MNGDMEKDKMVDGTDVVEEPVESMEEGGDEEETIKPVDPEANTAEEDSTAL